MIIRRQTPRGGRQGRAALLLVALPAVLALTQFAAGCSKSPEKTVVASVGPKKVTQAEYEARLARLPESELPRDPQGELLDTGTRMGRLAVLDGIVREKLMVLKAEEMGLGADQSIVGASQTQREYYAPTIMHADLVEKPASQVGEEEIAAYHQNMQQRRQFSFLICIPPTRY